MRVDIKKLYGWKSKVEETITDIIAERYSRQVGIPVTVSQLDTPRGTYFVLDGHHRVIEALKRKERTIQVDVSEHVPHIQRTGGAYDSYMQNMVPIQKFVGIK